MFMTNVNTKNCLVEKLLLFNRFSAFVSKLVKISFFAAYIQEIGRAGRDGEDAIATLWFNKSDIGKDKTHLMDDMRKFCMINSCRRDFILKYFGFELEEVIDPLHNCCDNCAVQCSCDTCTVVNTTVSPPHVEETILIDDNLNSAAKEALMFYFGTENDKINSSVPSAVSGLDEKFAEKLCTSILNLRDPNMDSLTSAFPHINQDYLSNILTILSAIRQ